MTFPIQIFVDGQAVQIDDMQAFESFKKDYRYIHAAGGIVKNARNEVLLIYRLGCWDLPKGKAEDGEQWEETAVREVQEETGLQKLKIIRPLTSTFHTYERDGAVLKETHWFLMSTEDEELTPQTEEDITQAVWVDIKKANGYMETTYPSLKLLWFNSEL